MGTLDSILPLDAAAMMADFGESITYTSWVNGIVGTPVTITAVIDRHQPEAMDEGSPSRVKRLTITIPNSAVSGVARVSLGDQVSAPWTIGDAAQTWRVVGRPAQDKGAWVFTVESGLSL